jgi:extracellular elastinolytic metalloproteinase
MKKNLLLATMLFSIGAIAQNRLEIVNHFLKTTAVNQKIITSPVEYNVINDHETINGTEYVKVQQKINGIPVFQAFGTFALKDGKVQNFNNSFITVSKSKSLETSPKLNASEAIEKFARKSGKNFILIQNAEDIKKNPEQLKQKVTGNDVAFIENSPAYLMYYNDHNQLKLAWILLADIKTPGADDEHGHQHSAYETIIDANTGDLLSKKPIINSCTFQPGFPNNNIYKNNPEDFEWIKKEYQTAPYTADGSYRVVPANFNSPLDHDYTLLSNVSDPVASAEGWHKKLSYVTNASVTDEYTIGNNSHVGYDANGEFSDLVNAFALMLIMNKSYIKNETKGNNYVFDFPNPGNSTNYDPLAYTDLANTQMFYSTNFIHDVLYHHGFTPAAGSFQANEGEGNNLIGFTSSGLGQSRVVNNAVMGYSGLLVKNPTALFYTFETPNNAGVMNISQGPLTGHYPGVLGNNSYPYTTSNITGDLILYNDGTGGDPNDGCEVAVNSSEFSGKIVAVNRGTCNFTDKVNKIKDFNPKGIIILNNSTTDMSGALDIGNPTLAIPVAAINKGIGDQIRTALNNNQTITATLPAEGFALTKRNGGLDSQVILHEYTHAVSKRLMNDAQSGEEQMGEGWSDYFAINLTQQPSQTAADQINMGSYAFGGSGMRVLPYTTDMNVNPHTYDYLKIIGAGANLEHPTGYLWALMLWEMHWALVNKYGFNPDIKGSTGGNNIALNLVIQGMKMGVANPGFVDGRNAILQADDALYGGQNKCDIWEAFAKRGLGYSANQGTSASRIDGTQAFDMPPADVLSCSLLAVDEVIKNDLSIFPNPAKDVVYINTKDKLTRAELIDMTGRLISRQSLQQNGNKAQIDTSGLQKGAYILKIYTEKGEITKKVLKN